MHILTKQQFQVHKNLQIYLHNWCMNMLQIVSILSGERGLSKQCPPTINEYLAAQERRVIKIKQDGNCFYSALSVQLFGTQDEDLSSCSKRGIQNGFAE